MTQIKRQIPLEEIVGQQAADPPRNPDDYPIVDRVTKATAEGRLEDARELRSKSSKNRMVEAKPNINLVESNK